MLRGALGEVRCVEGAICSKQVQQDGGGGEGAQGWICKSSKLLTLSRKEIKKKRLLLGEISSPL